MNNIKENYMDEHLPRRLLFAVLMAIIFMLLPIVFFYTYYGLLDQTQYYTVVQPVPVAQKWYKPCDDVVLTATRTSLLDISGAVQTDLVLKQNSDIIFKVPDAKFNRNVSISKGEKVTVSVSYPLPCGLADGLYYWQITLTYKVKGFQHQYTAISDTFNVNQYGLDPDVINAATSSAELQKLITPRIQNPSVRVSPTPAPEPKQESNQSNQGSQGSGSTTINNYQSQPNPTPAPQPTPGGTQVCLPLLGCVLK